MGAIIIFEEGQQRNHKRLKPHPAPRWESHTALVCPSFAEGIGEGQKKCKCKFQRSK